MPITPLVDQSTLPLMLREPHIRGITGLSRAKVYELLNTQGCPVVRFGRAIRVPRDAFLRWLDRQAGGIKRLAVTRDACIDGASGLRPAQKRDPPVAGLDQMFGNDKTGAAIVDADHFHLLDTEIRRWERTASVRARRKEYHKARKRHENRANDEHDQADEPGQEKQITPEGVLRLIASFDADEPSNQRRWTHRRPTPS